MAGFLWLDQKYLVEKNTMYRVSGLPTMGEDPTNTIKAKDATQDDIYTKYGMRRGSRGVVITKINDQRVFCDAISFL
jgi:hypothetical protein